MKEVSQSKVRVVDDSLNPLLFQSGTQSNITVFLNAQI